VEDSASPKITVTPAVGSYTGSQTVSVSLSETGSVRYSLSGSATALSPAYTGAFAINSDLTLSVYASDLSGNTGSTSAVYSFSCAASAPANGTIGAYPGCALSCNSGYSLSGAVCAAQVAIANAKSFDSNGNGYINGYRLTFDIPLPATMLAPSQIAVTSGPKTATGISFSGTAGSLTGTITWSDGLFDSGEIPAITVS
jgi:hypothetical protein